MQLKGFDGTCGAVSRSLVGRRWSATCRLRLASASRQSPLAPVFFGFVCAFAVAVCSAQGASASDRPTAPREMQLRAKLGEQRELMIQRLHEYWTRGDFVQNPDPSGGPGHFILDGRGKPCPLASIIIESGRRDLVEEAARLNNGVRVVDLHDGPILEWILRSGLTQEECVLIQRPSRSGEDIATPVRTEEGRRLAAELARVETMLRNSTEQNLTISLRRMLAAQRARNAARI